MFQVAVRSTILRNGTGVRRLRLLFCRRWVLALSGWIVLGHASRGFLALAESGRPGAMFEHSTAPRVQWNANSGYCGELSFIMAGLEFGQYCSQYTAREMASPGVPQHLERSQLLLGENDVRAARAMRLEATPFERSEGTTPADFARWAREHTLLGEVVIVGVFLNAVRMGEEATSQDDFIYDHIVPVVRWESDAGILDYNGNGDFLTISDHGLYGPVGDPPHFPFRFRYRVDRFAATRRQASRADGEVYYLPRQGPHFAIAIQGPADRDEVTIPVRLQASTNEEPPLPDGEDEPPEPAPLTLTASVSIPDPARAYWLYLYESFEQVPTSRFNSKADRASRRWHIPAGSGPTFTAVVKTNTAATAVFRAVPVSSP